MYTHYIFIHCKGTGNISSNLYIRGRGTFGVYISDVASLINISMRLLSFRISTYILTQVSYIRRARTCVCILIYCTVRILYIYVYICIRRYCILHYITRAFFDLVCTCSVCVHVHIFSLLFFSFIYGNPFFIELYGDTDARCFRGSFADINDATCVRSMSKRPQRDRPSPCV